MQEWVGEKGEGCRPCLLGPVVQWYQEVLEEGGFKELANNLVESTEADDPLTVCKKLDKIKDAVGETARERLMDFDCAAQNYEPTTEETEQDS